MPARKRRTPRSPTLMQRYDGQVPGASLLVLKDGQPVIERGFGLANLEDRIPASPETNYRLASITKQFTAASILLLAEDGKLRLDDPVKRWLPSLPAAADAITIRQLLSHTSGLIDYEEVMPADLQGQLHDIDVLHILEGQDRTYFAPGTSYRYSNSGYALLALIVAIPLGIAMGVSRAVSSFLTPLFRFFSVLAGIAWIPIATLWFGYGFGAITFVIFNAVFFIVAYNTLLGVSTIPLPVRHAAASLGAGRVAMLTECCCRRAAEHRHRHLADGLYQKIVEKRIDVFFVKFFLVLNRFRLQHHFGSAPDQMSKAVKESQKIPVSRMIVKPRVAEKADSVAV